MPVSPWYRWASLLHVILDVAVHNRPTDAALLAMLPWMCSSKGTNGVANMCAEIVTHALEVVMCSAVGAIAPTGKPQDWFKQCLVTAVTQLAEKPQDMPEEGANFSTVQYAVWFLTAKQFFLCNKAQFENWKKTMDEMEGFGHS